MKNKHPVIGELTQAKNETKKLVIVNAVETAEISRFSRTTNEHTHQWLDENGSEDRTSFVMNKDGMIYPVTLHIAKAKDGRNILYDVNVKINEGVAADKVATSLRAKKQAKQAVRTAKPSWKKVTQPKSKVKKFSDRDGNTMSYRAMEILANAKIVYDTKNKSVSHKDVENIVCGHFLRYGGYGERSGYRPTSQKLYSIILSGKKKSIETRGFHLQ